MSESAEALCPESGGDAALLNMSLADPAILTKSNDYYRAL
jgi:hypothetical protein